MSWKLVTDLATDIGGYKIQSQRDGDKTAHLITFPDERQIRVLPDVDHSGQYRVRVVKLALLSMAALDSHSESYPPKYDPMLYLYGSLWWSGLKWEQVKGASTLDDWLVEWFKNLKPGEIAPGLTVATLLADLRIGGWVVRRRDEV